MPTDNHDIPRPDEGQRPWSSDYYALVDVVEEAAEIRDYESNRSDYEPNNGSLFRARDSGAIYLGNGNEWLLVPLQVKEVKADQVSTAGVAGEITGGSLISSLVDGALKEHNGTLTVDTASAGYTPLPITTIPTSDSAKIPVRVPSDRTFYLHMWSLRTGAQTTPSDIEMQVYDHGINQAIAQESTAFSSPADPIATVDGPADLDLRLVNNSGSKEKAGALFGFEIR